MGRLPRRRKLERLVDLADEYADAGQWRNALRIAAPLSEEIAPQLESFHDEGGSLCGLVSRADAILAAALDAQEPLPEAERLTADERGWLIDTLMTIWEAEFRQGIEFAQEGPEAIARAATAEEQRRVAERVRQAIKPPVGENWYRSWQNQRAIDFLGLLRGDAGLSDDELLAEYRTAELLPEVADLLLEMGRVEEAISFASRKLTAAPALAAFADALLGTGNPERLHRAITLVDDRLWEQEGQNARDDEVLRHWLERQYAEHGQPEKALAMAHGRFTAMPAKATYDAVKAAALLPGQPGEPWPALREGLLATLRKREDWYGLIAIHLEDDEVEDALKALAQTEKKGRTSYAGWGYGWAGSADSWDARVAAAAETAFPDEAIRIYRRLADQLIAVRGRGNYQIAAAHLARVRSVLDATGRSEEWPAQIGEVRQGNKTLRALKEELDALELA